MKRRIIRADALNWAIQEYQEGGGTVERGRYAGQEKQARWKAPNAFYGRLEHAISGLFRDCVGDGPDGFTMDEATLLERIEQAEKRTIETLQEAISSQETSVLIGIIQERGYTVTDGKKGRTDYTGGD